MLVSAARTDASAQCGAVAIAYSPAALQEDLGFLRAKLQKSHPALCMYASRDRIDRCFDSLRSYLSSRRTDLQLVSAASALYPLLGDGHTMFLPGKSMAMRGMHACYLPIDIVHLRGHLFIRTNGTRDERIQSGAEVLAINGVPAAGIVDTLTWRQVRDGNNRTFPEWILNNWFKEYYRLSFGEPSMFTLDLVSSNDTVRLTTPALPRDSIKANILHNRSKRAIDAEQQVLSISSKGEHAALTIRSFDEFQDPGHPERSGKALMQQVFTEIRRNNVQRLVLDLRGNQGGDPALARLLLSYLVNEPFHLVLKGPASGRCRPQQDVFTGKLVVLMDGGSFSATGMVLSCLERHHRAIFIGEEAGGNRTVLSGSPRHFRLPNTGVDCSISTRLWQLSDRPNDGHGVMPDIPVSPTIEDIIHGRDPVMDAALKALD